MINDPYIGMPIIIDNDWNEPCPDCGCRPERGAALTAARTPVNRRKKAWI